MYVWHCFRRICRRTEHVYRRTDACFCSIGFIVCEIVFFMLFFFPPHYYSPRSIVGRAAANNERAEWRHTRWKSRQTNKTPVYPVTERKRDKLLLRTTGIKIIIRITVMAVQKQSSLRSRTSDMNTARVKRARVSFRWADPTCMHNECCHKL